MIAKLLKDRAICKGAVAISLILFSTIPLISCSSKSSDNSVTSNTNLSPENRSSEPNIVAEQTDETKIAPKKLTPSQVEEVKQALPDKDIIVDHAFEVNLKDFGNALFVPASEYAPKAKLGLYLVKDNQVKYTFPLPEDVKPWNFLELDAVSFEKVNSQNDDTGILLISKYWAGPGGPGTSEPFSVAMFYNQSNDSFQVHREITKKLIDKQVKTVAEARKFLN